MAHLLASALLLAAALPLAAPSSASSASSASPPPPPPPQAPRAARANSLRVAANVDSVVDWSWTLLLNDLVKQARPFGQPGSPWDANCSVGADGWPSQPDFGLLLLTLNADPRAGEATAAGTYTILFEGNATVAPNHLMAAGSAVGSQVYDPSTDSTSAVLSVPDGSGCNCVQLMFLGASTRAGGPGLKGVRVLQPGAAPAAADGFSDKALALLSRFDLLRFMDLASTNGQLISSWSNRTTPAAISFAPTFRDHQQLPWERVFELCNLLQTGCWINLPGHADDDYVSQLAALALATLDPALPLYFEYSNEVWNWSFEQCHNNYVLANASVYSGDPFRFNASGLDGNGNPGYWMIYRYVQQMVKFAAIFRGAFGDGSVGRNKRVRPVYAWQMGDAQELGFKYLTQFYPEPVLPAEVFHSIAVAPYFNPGDVAASPALTVDEVIAGWASSVANYSLDGPFGVGRGNDIAAAAETAAFWGVGLQFYEGGSDTVGGIDSGPPLWAKANASADPRLEGITLKYLTGLAAYGPVVEPLNWYTAGAGPLDDQYGIYSVTTDILNLDTPKLRGIDAARASTVPVSALIPSLDALPLVLNASFFVGHPIPPSPNGFFGWPPAPGYMLHASAPVSVRVTVTAGTDDTGVLPLNVTLGGAAPLLQTVSCKGSGNYQNYTACGETQPFAVPAGISVFRIGRPGNGLWLGTITFEAAASAAAS